MKQEQDINWERLKVGKDPGSELVPQRRLVRIEELPSLEITSMPYFHDTNLEYLKPDARTGTGDGAVYRGTGHLGTDRIYIKYWRHSSEYRNYMPGHIKTCVVKKHEQLFVAQNYNPDYSLSKDWCAKTGSEQTMTGEIQITPRPFPWTFITFEIKQGEEFVLLKNLGGIAAQNYYKPEQNWHMFWWYDPKCDEFTEANENPTEFFDIDTLVANHIRVNQTAFRRQVLDNIDHGAAAIMEKLGKMEAKKKHFGI